MKNYYEAYDERYRIIHEKGHQWASDVPTPLVLKVIKDLGLGKDARILEIGCGEGRDAAQILKEGYNLNATDISGEAVFWCKNKYPMYEASFNRLDVINDEHDKKYDFIYSVAVLHMLTEDEDRDRFYGFIYEHLEENGRALICTMGNGKIGIKSDSRIAFNITERDHEGGKVMVPATTCRMVTFRVFEKEIERAGLKTEHKGVEASMPDFNELMYAVVKKEI